MPSYLTFTISAPLGSFGGIAVGEQRPSWNRPAKSAILGLIAGAFGKDREDAEAHAAFARELFYAVRTEDIEVRSPNRLITDYHTVQSPKRGRSQYFATRREELGEKSKLGDGAIISYREYRSDCSFSIALWARGGNSSHSLEEIAQALHKPIFVPYVGRKACPLMLPMHPLVVEASTVKEAFKKRDEECKTKREFLKSHGLLAVPRTVALDADAPGEQGIRREMRRDLPLDRLRWQFTQREENIQRW